MPRKSSKPIDRIFDALPDTLDFRDKMYVPTLVEVPKVIDLVTYQRFNVPVLDQGSEGACTGFGLATVANYLLRHLQIERDPAAVSPRMFYQMAKRYDEWPGEDYSGSSARGAMKGWHKHGVCEEQVWPYWNGDVISNDLEFTNERGDDALQRPLGAYFRVNHKDLVAMHSAISEAGILYATASVHEGWQNVGPDGMIELDSSIIGGHAFAIVAYDKDGFWIQNSWGRDWGHNGFCHISYDDWLINGSDVWVGRLGVPVNVVTREGQVIARGKAPEQTQAYSVADLRPHIINVGNDGLLYESGTFGTAKKDVERIFREDFKRIVSKWGKPRNLLLYAHGGLTDENSAIQRIAEYRTTLLDHGIYPVSFVWKTDFWTTVKNILSDAARKRQPEGFLDSAKDFMLDRLDDTLEPLSILLGGKNVWSEMKENAAAATESAQGAARLAAKLIAELAEEENLKIHIVGHSAGSIFHAPLVKYLTDKGKNGLGLTVENCILWAPAITVDLFKETYLPAIQSKRIKNFTVFNLTDSAERDDNCAGIYHKSLLYLVSNAFEETAHIPLLQDGTPILGLTKCIEDDKDLKKLFDSGKAELVLSPNAETVGGPKGSRAAHHGDFDDDQATLKATLARITNVKQSSANIMIQRTSSSKRDIRQALESVMGGDRRNGRSPVQMH